jgi:DNA topoisomerase VI subunit A
MKSLVNALNNIASAIEKLANSLKKETHNSYTVPSKTTTSNPYSSNVKITSYREENSSTSVAITKAQYDALLAIKKALTDKGNHPHHHDHIVRELKIKWPVLSSALDQLLDSYSHVNKSSKSIWKY